MAHPAQREFCERVRDRFLSKFQDPDAVILDCGSLDINGNNRYLFASDDYLGIDVGAGKNVDRVCPIHLFDAPDETYDIIISTECFEHDRWYPESMQNITRMLKRGGLFLFTCATTGRPEHGTTRSEPDSAPFTNDY
ncbi:MAG: class I SAM-dependent methyltransferase, partial [Betaproteobacteria bacterium]|nr:class I SAM-dependent methyltransferase [Betaproteobacteria bacterium]